MLRSASVSCPCNIPGRGASAAGEVKCETRRISLLWDVISLFFLFLIWFKWWNRWFYFVLFPPYLRFPVPRSVRLPLLPLSLPPALPTPLVCVRACVRSSEGRGKAGGVRGGPCREVGGRCVGGVDSQSCQVPPAARSLQAFLILLIPSSRPLLPYLPA